LSYLINEKNENAYSQKEIRQAGIADYFSVEFDLRNRKPPPVAYPI